MLHQLNFIKLASPSIRTRTFERTRRKLINLSAITVLTAVHVDHVVVYTAAVASAIRAGAGLVVVGEQDASGTFSFSY